MLTSCSEFESLFEANGDMERRSREEGHGSGRIVINVGGQRHETYLTTLKNHPDTRLCWISERHHTSTKSPEYNAEKKEYFFDRHPGVFAHIVNYYRTGKLHCPMDVCGPLFEEELSFWGIDERQVELCCWENYKQHKEKQEKLKYFTPPDNDEDEDDDQDFRQSVWKTVKRKGYMLLEKPASSTAAKVVSIMNLITFLITIIQFCLTTLKSSQDDSDRNKILSGIRIYTVTWFLLDLVLRLLFTPSLMDHFKKLLHWLDLTSVCALIVHAKIHQGPARTDVSFYEMLIFLKAVRLFHLFTFSFVIQVLTNTLKASTRELGLLTAIVVFLAFLFSAILFFIERYDGSPNFESVPHSLWWAIITMTTVGYGDARPQTWIGKMLGCCCALVGVLVIALPVSVLSTNFELFYTYAKARLNLPPKAEQKLPFSKQVTSLKVNKEEPTHPSASHSCNSIARKNDQSRKSSLEGVQDNSCDDEKPYEMSSHRSSSTDRRHDSNSANPDSPLHDRQNGSVADRTAHLTPSFQECSFDFLEVPIGGKRLKKSFLTNSISRMLTALTQPARQNQTPKRPSHVDVNSIYPLYLRRGAVAPGSISSRSFSSTIYDSTSSTLPNCVRQSVTALRRRQRLSRSGKLASKRKCTSNAELHLVCLHRCDRHPSTGELDTSPADCSCSAGLSARSKPRQAKSCSELNDILQGHYRNSFSSINTDQMLSSGDISGPRLDKFQHKPRSEIAITINGCSDDASDSRDHEQLPLLQVNSLRTKDMYLNPWDKQH